MSSSRRSVRIHNHNDDALGTKLHEKRDRCIKQLKDAIVQQIPPQTSFDIVDLQNFYYKENYAVILGLAYVVVYVVILLYLSVTATQTEYNKKILAIDELTIGQSVCQDIPVSVIATAMSEGPARTAESWILDEGPCFWRSRAVTRFSSRVSTHGRD